MDMIKKAITLIDIQKHCKPFPLRGNELNSFFVETDDGRNPYQSTRDRLKGELKNDDDTQILFYGHKGCGKSTELNQLILELEDQYLTVQFSIEDYMHLVAICAEDLILIITERIRDKAVESGLEIDEQLIQPVVD